MLDINQALPYKNEINKIQIKGSTLKEVFEHSAEQLGEGGFLQVCVLFQDIWIYRLNAKMIEYQILKLGIWNECDYWYVKREGI